MSDDNQKEQPTTYECPECGLHYESEDLMKQCSAWCAEYKSCNMLITQHSVEVKQQQ